jgi:hypothetical protein
MSQPFMCPICQGRGNVPGGFYISHVGCPSVSTSVSEPCRACKGTGIIYGTDDHPKESGE